MRSRYAAFVLENEAHLLHTWHETTRPQHVDFDPLLRWTGLEILRAENGGVDDTRGLVEFRASFTQADEVGVVHEVSRFVRGATGWVYVRGRLVARPS